MEVPLNKIGLGDATKCRAFVIHRMLRVDYRYLERWATRQVTLFTSSLFADQNDWSDGAGPNYLMLKLRHLQFNPTLDYIVLSGDILRIATTCAVIGRAWPQFCMLRYDRDQEGYWPFAVDITGIGFPQN